MKKLAISAALAAASCGTLEPPGVYSAGIPAVKAEPQVRIHLRPDATASVQASFPDRPGRFYAEGNWQRAKDLIVIDLAGERPEQLVVEYAREHLVPRQWSRASWGEAGPGVLYRVR